MQMLRTYSCFSSLPTRRTAQAMQALFTFELSVDFKISLLTRQLYFVFNFKSIFVQS